MDNIQKKLFNGMDDFIEAIEEIQDNEIDYITFFKNLSRANKSETKQYIERYMIPYCNYFIKMLKQYKISV